VAVVQHRFVDVATRNADLFAVFHVGDGTPADGFLHRLLDMPTVALQEALAVYRALVLAVQTTVDDVAHKGPPANCRLLRLQTASLRGRSGAPSARAGELGPCYCDLRTRRYHSDNRRTCFSV